MPYIKDEYRQPLSPALTALIEKVRSTWSANPLSITKHIVYSVVARTMEPELGWNYSALNRAYGTFHSAAYEYGRRVLGSWAACETQINNPPLSDTYEIEPLLSDLVNAIRSYRPAIAEAKIDGIVNYTITMIVVECLRHQPGRVAWVQSLGHDVLINAAWEFYRNLVGPYEDRAISTNGDIPGYAELTG